MHHRHGGAREHVAGTDDDRIPALIREALRRMEMTYRTKKGSLVPVLFSGSIMLNERERLYRVVGVAKDITKLKRVQEQLEETAQELARSNQYLEQWSKTKWAIQRYASGIRKSPDKS